MQTLSQKQFLRALPISLAIVVSILTLLMVFLIVIPSFSSVSVHRDDRAVVEELRHLATWMVVITALCGAALGVCIPMAIRWAIKRRKERHEQKAA
jgi:ABC-type Fe3+ transport system permease subunit